MASNSAAVVGRLAVAARVLAVVDLVAGLEGSPDVPVVVVVDLVDVEEVPEGLSFGRAPEDVPKPEPENPTDVEGAEVARVLGRGGVGGAEAGGVGLFGVKSNLTFFFFLLHWGDFKDKCKACALSLAALAALAFALPAAAVSSRRNSLESSEEVSESSVTASCSS